MAKGRITIAEDRCKGCELCIPACPQGLLEISGHLNVLGYYPVVVGGNTDCKGCALCAVMCPDVAIEVEREEN